jgi:predicted patatin/cPLA2 family phospholipase
LLASGPEFRALAVSLETLTLRVLADFTDIDELTQAVRASAALPRLGGRPPVFRGERMADGGLLEAIPYETALREGATHILVLRSRPRGYRKPAYGSAAERLALRGESQLVELLRGQPDAYNRQAAALESAVREDPDGRVLEIAVPAGTRLIRRLEANPGRVVDALRIGAVTMGRAIFADPIELCWQPVAYRAAAEAPGPARRPSPARWWATVRRAPAQL